jgi:hypothetical protein
MFNNSENLILLFLIIILIFFILKKCKENFLDTCTKDDINCCCGIKYDPSNQKCLNCIILNSN